MVKAAQSAIEMSGADEATIAEATDIWFKAKFFYMYGQDSSEGVHGIGNPNTGYCWDQAVETCEQIIAMV